MISEVSVQRWRGVGDVPRGWERCVVTIGMFDGVHRGHRQIIGRAVGRARAAGQPCVVVSFDPHPATVVRPGTHPAVLTTPRQKAELLAGLGVDVQCVVPFTVELSRLSPAAFAHQVLVTGLHASAVVVGDNFRFGHKAAGNVETLAELGRDFGFVTEGVPLLHDGETRISSTLVRTCVAGGDVEAAARALGRDHRIEGVVVRGDARGRELGYPTANLQTAEWVAIPADGVYAGYLVRRGEQLLSAISIGTNPTFDGEEQRVEAFVLPEAAGGWLDLYGEHLSLDFHTRLRPTVKFDGIEPLLEQMARDVENTRLAVA